MEEKTKQRIDEGRIVPPKVDRPTTGKTSHQGSNITRMQDGKVIPPRVPRPPKK